MFKLMFLFLLSFSAVADEWITADTYREVTYQVIQAADWAQTRSLRRGDVLCSRYGQSNCYQYEQNAILGPRPSQDRIDVYFVVMAVAHYFIADELSEKYRAPFQYISIGYEAGVVNRNYHLGISAKF